MGQQHEWRDGWPRDFGRDGVSGLVSLDRALRARDVSRPDAEDEQEALDVLADLHAQTCSAGYRSVINGVSLYEDTLHFTPRGAAMIWTWLAPQVQRAGAAR